ncbi:hypothetical protein JNUCC1_00698 [Lentibacillus sp. JNUCC-1]|uniref:metallophosphoesterase n=1 Tax=Lentibacillus sp. JNUCC-1 TaxID=2654513 RepID=UPI0012E889B9|nr:metallophosphoesterase [Lentibacillus sp. JNUCC-1]MUV36894.1 hypothetical protein [Lentibacillus sp. JNUCC-1]
MRKLVGRFIKVILIVCAAFIIYVFWDNNRVKLVEEDIVLEQLPSQFDGFTILQLTDLHEKNFGRGQKRLLKAINSIDYDVIVMTGDMMNTPDSTHVEPFYTLLEGIDDKEHAYFVRGNDDPPSYELEPEFGKSPFIKGVEKRGVTFLESVMSIEKDDAHIHFVNFELAIIKGPEHIGKINGTDQLDYVEDARYKAYQGARWEEFDMNVFSEDVVIALNHYPVVDERVDYIQGDAKTEWRDIDLILAGHYHGGQYRLPFVGALFVPEPWYEPNQLFPPQDRVKGLWEYNGTQQYVSAGLGSSDAIQLLKFRLFNPPEINLLKLKSDGK